MLGRILECLPDDVHPSQRCTALFGGRFGSFTLTTMFKHKLVNPPSLNGFWALISVKHETWSGLKSRSVFRNEEKSDGFIFGGKNVSLFWHPLDEFPHPSQFVFRTMRFCEVELKLLQVTLSDLIFSNRIANFDLSMPNVNVVKLQ